MLCAGGNQPQEQTVNYADSNFGLFTLTFYQALAHVDNINRFTHSNWQSVIFLHLSVV